MSNMPTGEHLQQFMGDTPIEASTAATSIDAATALVDGYTRSNHLDHDGTPRPGVAHVVLTVAARIAANPGQVSYRVSAGAFSKQVGKGFSGFTLAELSILNRYRKRAL